MTKLEEMFYSQLCSRAIIHGNPVQQLILRFGLAIAEYGWYPDMIQALFILARDTRRCYKDAINASPVEGFDDCHLLVGIIVGGAENDAKATDPSYFFNALHNIAKERIINRRNHQANRACAPHLQALRDGIRCIAHLSRQAADAFSHINANQWAVTQCT